MIVRCCFLFVSSSSRGWMVLFIFDVYVMVFLSMILNLWFFIFKFWFFWYFLIYKGYIGMEVVDGLEICNFYGNMFCVYFLYFLVLILED